MLDAPPHSADLTVQVPLGDGRIALARTTPGHGIPVVLLHGLLDCSRGWEAICRALAAPTVALDLPGFGCSSPVPAPRLDAYADDIVRALAPLRPGPFVLVGHSFGGAVAASVAERLRGDVAALVLLAPAGFGRIPLAEAASLPVVRTIVDRLAPLAFARPAVAAGVYRVAVSPGAAPDASLVAKLARDPRRLTTAARHAVSALVAAGLAVDGFHRREVGYDGPVHCVWGSRDRIVPLAHLAGVEAGFPRVLAQVWEGMGHHHQHEEPERLVALIDEVAAAAALPNLAAARRARRRTPARQAAAA